MELHKLELLQNIDYEIQSTCGLCRHGHFKDSDWGKCDLHSFKHNGEIKDLDTHRYGFCKIFKTCHDKQNALGLYKGFMK